MEANFWLVLGVQTIAFGLGAIRLYTDMKIKLREHDLRLKTLEKKEDETAVQFKEIMQALNEIKLELKDKADKP
jgi:hypothetical protein